MGKYLVVLILLSPILIRAQSFLSDARKEMEVGTFFSTSGRNPFWLRSNQNGIVPLESQGVTFRARISTSPLPPGSPAAPDGGDDATSNFLLRDWNQLSTSPRKTGAGISLNYALEVVANAGKMNQILLPEAFLGVRWRALELYAGRRREVVGLVDSTLSSGSYIWSGNALPIPKIQLSLLDYVPIFGKGLISIKGSYAHGWFNNGVVKNFYLHQKTFYGRIGRSDWKVKFYAGFNHQVQWGGKPIKPYLDELTGQLITKYSNGFPTYVQVVTGKSLIGDGTSLDPNGLPFNEAFNRAGNHLGTIDFGSEINLRRGKLLVYRQSVYDDGSLFYLSNISDGLLGISYKKSNYGQGVNQVVVEYLKTTNQGGEIGSGSTIPQLRGGDNYFNNGVYTDGWTYLSRTLGSPFVVRNADITSLLTDKLNIPAGNDNLLVNNRVNAFYVGIDSKWGSFYCTTKIAVATNFGSYQYPLNQNTNFSFLQQVRFLQKSDYLLSGSFAFDAGQLYGMQAGVMVTAKRVW